MMMVNLNLEVTFLLLFTSMSPVLTQSDGDLMLTGSINASFGRVKIYYNGTWGTICDHNYGGAAKTICYQLNYISDAWYHPGTNFKDMNESLSRSGFSLESINASSPIHLRDIDCGALYANPPDTIHILRCNVKASDISKCTHEDDLTVFCGPQRGTPDSSYDSEVRLVGGRYASAGKLEIFLKQKWGSVCFDGFDQVVADTACRQMGYTHAQNFTKTDTKSANVVWIDGHSISCGGKSQPCLSHCIDKDKIKQISCPDKNYVMLNCSFDHDYSYLRSGNRVLCLLKKKYSKTPAYFVAIMSTAGFLWIVSVVTIIVMAVCCTVPKCPCYRKYKLTEKYSVQYIDDM